MLHFIQKMRPSVFSSNFYHGDTENTKLHGVFLALPSPHRLLALSSSPLRSLSLSVSSSPFRSLSFLLSYHGDTEITELHGVFLALLSSLQSLSLPFALSPHRPFALSVSQSLRLFISISLSLLLFYHGDTEITELHGVFLALPSPHRLLAPSVSQSLRLFVSSSPFRSLAFSLSNTFFDHRYQVFFFIGFGNIFVAASH